MMHQDASQAAGARQASDDRMAAGLPTPGNAPEPPPTAPVPTTPVDDPDAGAPMREEPGEGEPGTEPGGPPAPMIA